MRVCYCRCEKRKRNLPASLKLLAMFGDIRALHEGVQMTSASILAQKPSADESEWAPLVCRSVLTAQNSQQCAGESVIEIVISSEGKAWTSLESFSYAVTFDVSYRNREDSPPVFSFMTHDDAWNYSCNGAYHESVTAAAAANASVPLFHEVCKR